jgi:hypothetical protein
MLALSIIALPTLTQEVQPEASKIHDMEANVAFAETTESDVVDRYHWAIPEISEWRSISTPKSQVAMTRGSMSREKAS